MADPRNSVSLRKQSRSAWIVGVAAVVVLGSVPPALLVAQRPASANEKRGEELYLQRCSVCHEQTSAFAEPYGPVLDREVIAPLNAASVRNLVVRGTARMPGFQYSLTSAEIDAVMAHLAVRAPASDRPYTPPSRVNPVAGPMVSSPIAGTVLSGGKPVVGATISARANGRTFTTSIYSNERGEFSFPPLEAGTYAVRAQAVGYAAGKADVTVAQGRPANQKFTLSEIQDFEKQLSGAGYIAALPEDTQSHKRMKEIFLSTCTGCHPPNFVLLNKFDQNGWRAIVEAMARISATGTWAKMPQPIIAHYADDLVAYLAEMRGPGPSPMKFTRPQPITGESAKVVMTEYDVEREDAPPLALHDGINWENGPPSSYRSGSPHDVVADADGNAWVTDASANIFRSYTKVDAKTGRTTAFKVAGGREGAVRGTHQITNAPDGTLWTNISAAAATEADADTSGAGGLGRLDPKTGKLEIFTPPKGMLPIGGFVMMDGKGKVWGQTPRGIQRLDPATGQFTNTYTGPTNQKRGAVNYGVAADSNGNGWWAITSHNVVSFVDSTTGKTEEFPMRPRAEITPLLTDADRAFIASMNGVVVSGANLALVTAQGPRRWGNDLTGRKVYLGNRLGNNLLEFNVDTKVPTYHDVPSHGAGPYAVAVDANHNVWTCLFNTDQIARFNPTTKQWTMFQVPTVGAEMRFLSVDSKTGDVWASYFRGSKVVRLHFPTGTDASTSSR